MSLAIHWFQYIQSNYYHFRFAFRLRPNENQLMSFSEVRKRTIFCELYWESTTKLIIWVLPQLLIRMIF